MSPELVIPVADLEQGPKHVVFVLSEAWLRRALQGTDATVTAPGKVEVTLSKTGGSVLVRGQIEADVTLPCVVTLDPVPIPVRTELVLMLSPRGGATTAHESHVARRKARPESKSATLPDKSGAEKPTRSRTSAKAEGKWDETPILSDEIAGQDTYDGHEIALDDFVREFVILELPMFPRRSDLPIEQTAANPPLPADSQPGGDKPLDPRLSPLAELKSRLEQKIKKE
ncbi:MAG: DUF177 domain-containing protein [Myxococcales bacterium]|nr:MAG: DUF177 domain-containing protein [Myxococcales bacterium]